MKKEVSHEDKSTVVIIIDSVVSIEVLKSGYKKQSYFVSFRQCLGT
ncbi:MAG: hypothetical protein N4A76_12940 [Firmicutes bacterium]|jgi:hypothetical protein|nr:hypothetical protein [Bacillota bacterium]